MVMLISGCASRRALTVDEKAIINELPGQTYYTQTNIWFSDLGGPRYNDYHKGSVFPVGSKVRIVDCLGEKINFSDESGVVYGMVQRRKNGVDIMTFFNRYFSNENVMAEGGVFSKFTKQDQENIKRGTVDYGMSKEAVLMAYGYPSTQGFSASDIRSNQWEYLELSNRRTYVYFQDNIIVKIEDTRPRHARPFKGLRQTATVRVKSQINTLASIDSNADEITKYKELLDKGAITKEEYEQKKKQLLGL